MLLLTGKMRMQLTLLSGTVMQLKMLMFFVCNFSKAVTEYVLTYEKAWHHYYSQHLKFVDIPKKRLLISNAKLDLQSSTCFIVMQ